MRVGGARVRWCACALLRGRCWVRAGGARAWVCARLFVRYSSRCCVVVLRCSSRRCACVVAWSRARTGLARVCVWGGRACVRGPPPGGVLWRFPTLPHPLGCSTIGAAGLSFQVRNVAGRFPGAVTTTRLCRPPPLLLARRVAGCPGPLCGGVGGGLVVVRIVVAAPPCPPLLPLFGPCLWARRGWGVSGCPSPPCWPRFWCLGLAVPGPPLWRC